MAQRHSGHARIARDAYETPAWVTHAASIAKSGWYTVSVSKDGDEVFSHYDY